MDTRHCSFCNRSNPVDAKFCNACGSSLHLQLCKHCGAIDNISSKSCYKCGTPFGFVWEGGDPARTRGDEVAGGPARASADEGESPRDAAEGGAPPSAAAAPEPLPGSAQEGAADSGKPAGRFGRGFTALRFDAMKSLSLVLLVVAAIFALQLFTADEAPQVVKRNIVDATLGAVPPRQPASIEVIPIATRPEPPASPPASPSVAPEPAAALESDAVSEQEDEAARARPSPPCSAEVDALGLCN